MPVLQYRDSKTGNILLINLTIQNYIPIFVK